MNKDIDIVVYYVTMKDMQEIKKEKELHQSGREINSEKMLGEKLITDITETQQPPHFADKRFRDMKNKNKKQIEQYRMKREKTFVANSSISPESLDTTKYRPKSAGRSLHRTPKYTGDSDSDSDVFDGDIEILDLDSIEDCEKAIHTARVPKPPETERNTSLWTPREARIHANEIPQTQTSGSVGHSSSQSHDVTHGAHGEIKANGMLRIKRKHLRRKYLSEVEKLDDPVIEYGNLTSPPKSSNQSMSDDSSTDMIQSVEIISMKTLDIRQRRRSTGRGELVTSDQSDVSGSPCDTDLIPTELHYQEAAAKVLERITRRASDSSYTEDRKLSVPYQSEIYNTIPMQSKPTRVRPQIPRKLKPIFNHPEPRLNPEHSDFILKDIKREETIPFTREMYQKSKKEEHDSHQVLSLDCDRNIQRQGTAFVVNTNQNSQTGNGKTHETKQIIQRRKLKPVQTLHSLPTLESSDVPDIQEVKDKLHIINSPLNKMAPIGSNNFSSQKADDLRCSDDGRYGNQTNKVFTVESKSTDNDSGTRLTTHNGINSDQIKSITNENYHKTAQIQARGSGKNNINNSVNIYTNNKLYVKKPIGRTKSAPD